MRRNGDKRPHILSGAEHLVSGILGVLTIIGLCLTTAFTQSLRQVSCGECAVQIEIFGRFYDTFCDVEIGGILRWERSLRGGLRSLLGRWACGRLEQRGHQLTIWQALVELVDSVTACAATQLQRLKLGSKTCHYVRTNDASCSMPLCTSISARSKRPVL